MFMVILCLMDYISSIFVITFIPFICIICFYTQIVWPMYLQVDIEEQGSRSRDVTNPCNNYGGMYVASYKAHCLPYPIYHNFKVAIEISLHPGRPLLHDLLIAFILICSCLERAHMIPFHGGKNGELFLLHVFNFSFAVVE